MHKKSIFKIIAVLIMYASVLYGQTSTVGLMLNDTSKVFKGYTLFAPKHYTATYLINNEGRIMHQWNNSKYEPGQSVYLLENGHLLRSCMTKGKLSTGGGEGGRIEEYDWNDNLVWQMDISTDTYMQHHDIRLLPNGNIIMLVVEKKTFAEVLAAGFDPTKMQPDVQSKDLMLPDAVFEIKPTYPSGGTIVWEWHVWDHLIQDFDASKNYYGVVKDHPELIDAGGDQKSLAQFWNHMNSIDYNPALDQILMSVRGNSEIWIIDHSTTTAQAKSHVGGKYGKGGDLLYRWGNPVCYAAGTTASQMLYQQHDAEWIRPGCPGEGNIMAFNNGLGRSYSSVDEFTPPIDSTGNYKITKSQAFGPASFTWSYTAAPPSSLYAEAISGAQRLPNGNTIIDDGTHGTFTEVTSKGQVAWKYICPVVATGPMNQGNQIPDDPVRAGEKMNAVFRVYKYPVSYAAFTGKNLTPGNFVEKYTTSVDDAENTMPGSFRLEQNYPNPFNPSTTLSYSIPEDCHVQLRIYDVLGNSVGTLVNEMQNRGKYNINFNSEHLSSGIYYYSISAGQYKDVKKMMVIK